MAEEMLRDLFANNGGNGIDWPSTTDSLVSELSDLLDQVDFGGIVWGILHLSLGLLYEILIRFWWLIAIILIVGIPFGIYKLIGPPAKFGMDPETYYTLCYLDQPIDRVLLHSDLLYQKNGRLYPRPPGDKPFRIFGSLEIIWGWPLIYIKKDNPDGTTPQKPKSCARYNRKLTAKHGEMADTAGTRSRDITISAIERVFYPYGKDYGNAPRGKDFEATLESRYKKVIANILRITKEEDVEKGKVLEAAIQGALIDEEALLPQLSSEQSIAQRLFQALEDLYDYRRPAQGIIDDFCIVILRVDMEQSNRPEKEESAAQIRREGEEQILIEKKRIEINKDFINWLSGLISPEQAANIWAVATMGGSLVGGDGGTGAAAILPLAGMGGYDKSAKPRKAGGSSKGTPRASRLKKIRRRRSP